MSVPNLDPHDFARQVLGLFGTVRINQRSRALEVLLHECRLLGSKLSFDFQKMDEYIGDKLQRVLLSNLSSSRKELESMIINNHKEVEAKLANLFDELSSEEYLEDCFGCLSDSLKEVMDPHEVVNIETE